MRGGSGESSYLWLIDYCITQLQVSKVIKQNKRLKGVCADPDGEGVSGQALLHPPTFLYYTTGGRLATCHIATGTNGGMEAGGEGERAIGRQGGWEAA